jgi:hypothetical protein
LEGHADFIFRIEVRRVMGLMSWMGLGGRLGLTSALKMEQHVPMKDWPMIKHNMMQ